VSARTISVRNIISSPSRPTATSRLAAGANASGVASVSFASAHVVARQWLAPRAVGRGRARRRPVSAYEMGAAAAAGAGTSSPAARTTTTSGAAMSSSSAATSIAARSSTRERVSSAEARFRRFFFAPFRAESGDGGIPPPEGRRTPRISHTMCGSRHRSSEAPAAPSATPSASSSRHVSIRSTRDSARAPLPDRKCSAAESSN